MVYSILSNIILGVIGGIVSSVIVSKVFLIQGDYQEHCKIIDQLLHKLFYIGTFYQAAKIVFQVSYDGDIEMQHEMEKHGYKTEDEYYAANADKDWISKSALLKQFLVDVHKTAKSASEDILNANITIKSFMPVMNKIGSLQVKAERMKEFTFSQIDEYERELKSIEVQYKALRKNSSRQICGLIIRDKTMIILFCLLLVLIVATVFSRHLGI